MINQYINNVKRRKNRRELKEIYFFGYGFGIIITLAFLLIYLFNDIDLTHDKYYILGVIVGLIIIFFTIVYPKALKYPKKIVSKILSIIFYLIYMILLTIVYYLCVFPIGLILKRKKRLNISVNKKDISTFSEYENMEYSIEKKRKNILFQVFSIFSFFLKKEYIILFPSLIIIIVLGLLFVFFQSSIVAPFIYTLV